MSKTHAGRLIAELNADPKIFFDRGRGYDLLQEYFKGADVTSLADLLKHENLAARKSAIWIASELGKEAVPVVDSILPLLKDEERYVRCYALEVVAVCSEAGMKGVFHHVVSSLDDKDIVVKELGMFLISNAFISELEEAIRHFSRTGSFAHERGLKSLLVTPNDGQTTDELCRGLYGSNGIVAMYKAIYLKRYVVDIGQKVVFRIDQVQDEATREFLADHLN